MAFERKVSSGYQSIFAPLGLSGTRSRFSNSISDNARKREFDVEDEDANTFSNSSPSRNRPRNPTPSAKPACRLTHRTSRGRGHHDNSDLHSDRSRINNQRPASNSEMIWRRTP